MISRWIPITAVMKFVEKKRSPVRSNGLQTVDRHRGCAGPNPHHVAGCHLRRPFRLDFTTRADCLLIHPHRSHHSPVGRTGQGQAGRNSQKSLLIRKVVSEQGTCWSRNIGSVSHWPSPSSCCSAIEVVRNASPAS